MEGSVRRVAGEIENEFHRFASGVDGTPFRPAGAFQSLQFAAEAKSSGMAASTW